MSDPLTTNPPDSPDAEIQPFEFPLGPLDLGDTLPDHDQQQARTREELIAQTLGWCADLFGASRARFIRPMPSGDWVIYTRQQESVLTHMADWAEIAMAYTVGLSRQPIVVNRPRISRIDGSGLRPIALKTYLGIPVICQDRLVGVVEFAGDVRPDIDSALYSAMPRLANAGERLIFDPGLERRPQAIGPDTRISLTAAVWSRGDITITPEELSLLAAITGPTTVASAASIANLDIERAIELASGMLNRGLVQIGTE